MRTFHGLVIVHVSLLVMLGLGACQSVALTTSEPSPVEVIEALEEAFNAQNIDAIMALYAEDAVFTETNVTHFDTDVTSVTTDQRVE